MAFFFSFSKLLLLLCKKGKPTRIRFCSSRHLVFVCRICLSVLTDLSRPVVLAVLLCTPGMM